MGSLQTWGEQLAEVQTAISAVLTNQRYSINGREIQRADLQYLQKRAEYLANKLATEGDVIAGSIISRGAMKVVFT